MAGEPTDPPSASLFPVPDEEHSNYDAVILLRAEKALKEAANNLKPGQIAFNVPEDMQVAETNVVEVRVSDDLKRDLKQGLIGKIDTAQIKVSSFMKARLEGTSFTIKPLDEENRALPEGTVAKWRWNVTPNESGEQKLFLVLYARIKIPDQQTDELVDLKTFDHTIKVAVNPVGWLGQNGTGIIETTIALSGAGFFTFLVARWKWIKNRLQKKTPKA
ncbi:hypothetical protein IQ259_25440 [Fortiea sp. LEGE XX443]|uniref:hypothetical protein n=1 Tax=Fortiea sp. LEGE XX443 TaxID=1828611 RepID=UPI0019DC490B|nr:hypothetical protein [Fortiea sp. LEGE XX443]MBE9008311.1 hypothetical protein [Fortiea sp. LEGE XX443]